MADNTETTAAANLLTRAMQAETESEFTLLIQVAKSLDNGIDISHYHQEWLEGWLEKTRKERLDRK